jgi:hypothetical protein
VDARLTLADADIVLFEQIAHEDIGELARKTGLPHDLFRKLKEKIEPQITW